MRLAEDVLTVLSRLEIDATAMEVKIPEQLARRHYLAVNNALIEMGGAWNRKRRAHVFSRDPSPLVEQAILTGAVSTRAELGFFPTPAPLAREVARSLGVERRRVLEPSAGAGALIDAALTEGALEVVACEIDDGRRADLHQLAEDLAGGGRRVRIAGADFFDVEVCDTFDRVLMNPPFARDREGRDCLSHVWQAWRFVRPGGKLASILPLGVHFRQDRRHERFREWVLSLGGTCDPLPADAFVQSGTRVRTVLVTVERPL